MSADLIVTRARVLTMDAGNPRAEAVAVRGGRILLVGSDADALALRGPATRVIDAGGPVEATANAVWRHVEPLVR